MKEIFKNILQTIAWMLIFDYFIYFQAKRKCMKKVENVFDWLGGILMLLFIICGLIWIWM